MFKNYCSKKNFVRKTCQKVIVKKNIVQKMLFKIFFEKQKKHVKCFFFFEKFKKLLFK